MQNVRAEGAGAHKGHPYGEGWRPEGAPPPFPSAGPGAFCKGLRWKNGRIVASPYPRDGAITSSANQWSFSMKWSTVLVWPRERLVAVAPASRLALTASSHSSAESGMRVSPSSRWVPFLPLDEDRRHDDVEGAGAARRTRGGSSSSPAPRGAAPA